MSCILLIKAAMKTQYQLEVIEPCTEEWAKMKAGGENNSRFCDSCQKNVIDFTRMSNKEMLRFINSKENICGRFRKEQLGLHEERLLSERFISNLQLIKAGILSFLLTIGISNRADACNNHTTLGEVEIEQPLNIPQVKQDAQDSLITVRGVVTDDQGEPLPGVNILLKGRLDGTVSDIDGKFEYPYKLSIGDTLVFSFIGFATQEIVIDKNSSMSELKMELDAIVLGGVGSSIVAGGVRVQRFSFLGRWWYGLTGIFR